LPEIGSEGVIPVVEIQPTLGLEELPLRTGLPVAAEVLNLSIFFPQACLRNAPS
jgi:hypothetical protein